MCYRLFSLEFVGIGGCRTLTVQVPIDSEYDSSSDGHCITSLHTLLLLRHIRLGGTVSLRLRFVVQVDIPLEGGSDRHPSTRRQHVISGKTVQLDE